MNTVYLDTNIFVYSNDSASPFFLKCNKFVEYSLKTNIDLATSTETIQEIVHLAKKSKNLGLGLKTADIVLRLTQLLLPVDKETIFVYLDLLQKHKNIKQVESRDFIHISACVRYDIKIFVTYDKDFKQFKEIQSLTPEEFLNKFKS